MTKKKEIPVGKVINGPITKELDRRFLSSIDLAGQGTVGLTLDRVEKVPELEYLNGQKDQDVILAYFAETEKPLKLCVTNIRSIIQITGTSTVKKWQGVKIGLHAVEGVFFGKKQLAVRIDEGYRG